MPALEWSKRSQRYVSRCSSCASKLYKDKKKGVHKVLEKLYMGWFDLAICFPLFV